MDVVPAPSTNRDVTEDWVRFSRNRVVVAQREPLAGRRNLFAGLVVEHTIVGLDHVYLHPTRP